MWETVYCKSAPRITELIIFQRRHRRVFDFVGVERAAWGCYRGAGMPVGARRRCMWWMGFTSPEDKGCRQRHEMRNMDLSAAREKSIKAQQTECVSARVCVCSRYLHMFVVWTRRRRRVKTPVKVTLEVISAPTFFYPLLNPRHSDCRNRTCRSQMCTCI